MASAYASVVSVLNIIDKIQKHHASHIKSIADNTLIDALQERAICLQDFLEAYHDFQPHVDDNDDEDINAERVGLESRIADAAYAAEDILESHIVDSIHKQYKKTKKKKWVKFLQEIPPTILMNMIQRKMMRSSIHKFDQSLDKVIRDMDLIIEEEVKMIKLQMKTQAPKDLDEQSTNTISVLRPSSLSDSTPPFRNAKNVTTPCMVGFEEYMTTIMEKLTGQGLNLKVIPISGMGGIGKTTLARNVHEDPLIAHYFDRRAWAAISQQFSVWKILSDLLVEICGGLTEQDNCSNDELGEKLYKGLCGRRYLIILDDMWGIEAWDEVKSYFPDNKNGSRIVVTTRISPLASHLGSCFGLKLDFLDDSKSLNLLCRKVFGDETAGNFPDDHVELEKLGKKIAQKCRGLPLSIVTVGGLLTKSDKTARYWKYVKRNLSSIISSDDNDHCLKILSLSYSHLPIHLKPCFLHMGHLSEDWNIHSTKLVKLWVAEGFLKPNKAKSLEEVGHDYLNDLIERNLILFTEWKPTGKHERCSMHDLVRDLCLREAHKDNFLYLVNKTTNPNIERQRRLVIDRGLEMDSITNNGAFVRSFLSYDEVIHPSATYRLLRVLDAWDTCLDYDVFAHVNSCYLHFKVSSNSLKLPSSISLLWNLESLSIDGAPWGKPIVVPVEIWGMHQLKHLRLHKSAILVGPPSSCGHDNSLVLRNLEKIGYVINFKLTEDVIRRVPNIKKLGVWCSSEFEHLAEDQDGCCVIENLHRLDKLESLLLTLYTCPHSLLDNWQQKINFPSSIKELTLQYSRLPWESMTKIGLLPHLERLYLWYESFFGDEWNPVDNRRQFMSLKFLEIYGCRLKCWKANETCFPRLERLVLKKVDGLEEIPLDIGHTPTLQSIYFENCSQGVFSSAKEILEQQRSFGNETLQVLTEDGPISLDE